MDWNVFMYASDGEMSNYYQKYGIFAFIWSYLKDYNFKSSQRQHEFIHIQTILYISNKGINNQNEGK